MLEISMPRALSSQLSFCPSHQLLVVVSMTRIKRPLENALGEDAGRLQTKKKRRTYSQEDLCLALSLVKEQGFSPRQAEARSGVPRSSIQRYLKGAISVLKPMGNPVMLASRLLHSHEEHALVGALLAVEGLGFPLDEDSLGDLLREWVRVSGRKLHSLARRCQHDTSYKVSATYIRDFLSRHPEIERYKCSSIDLTRAAKATREVRDNFFDGVARQAIARLHSENKIPWATPEEVPANKVWNLDEAGADVSKGGKKKFGAKTGSKKEWKRRFSVEDGDGRQLFHVSGAISTRADGADFHCSLIHSAPGTANPRQSVEMLEATSYEDTRIDAIITENGSMQRSVFEWWSRRFVAYLRERGEAGPVILYFDGHTSRWNLTALQFLVASAVYPICLPSHTSAWSQPNDNGPNSSLKALLRSEYLAWRNRNKWVKINRTEWTMVFVSAWQKFRKEEGRQLQKKGENRTTRAWERTGLLPFNKFAVNWTEAIDTLGTAQAMVNCDELALIAAKPRYQHPTTPRDAFLAHCFRQMMEPAVRGRIEAEVRAQMAKEKRVGSKKKASLPQSTFGMDVTHPEKLAAIRMYEEEQEREAEQKAKRKVEAEERKEAAARKRSEDGAAAKRLLTAACGEFTASCDHELNADAVREIANKLFQVSDLRALVAEQQLDTMKKGNDGKKSQKSKAELVATLNVRPFLDPKVAE